MYGWHNPAPPLPDMMVRMASLSQKYGLRVANVFHAGDGNLHPLILFDANQLMNCNGPKILALISCGLVWKWAAF